MKKENVILTKFLRIGDRVEMNMDKESHGWGAKAPADGTLGTVIGFYRYLDAVPRNRIHSNLTAGIYEGNGAAHIAWDNGEFTTSGGNEIAFCDQELNDVRRMDKPYQDAFERKVRVSDLPELPFYEGDIVMLHNEQGTIINIDYNSCNEKCNDGSPLPIYDLEYSHDRGITRTIADALTLIERGNYWFYYHNEIDRVKFNDLREEAAFYQSLGLSEEVKNPKTNNYGWTIDEAFDAIRDGTGDAVRLSTAFFGNTCRPVVVRFPTMPELGSRLREEALKQSQQEQS